MIKRKYSPNWKDYELLDAGGNRKLERWGEVITIRPEHQAYFKPADTIGNWRKLAHLEFVPKGKNSGTWNVLKKIPKEWKIRYQSLTFLVEQTKFKHLGLFPEQVVNWKLIADFLQPGMKMLNLFAYTGAASIVGRSKGAEVTHVDAVKQLITWARQNMEASGISDIRWICEDALKFVSKEVSRKHNYSLILMDPPAWGIGANNEKWKIENQLETLIENASHLLEKDGLLIVNTYSPRVKANEIAEIADPFFNRVEVTELWKKTKAKKELYYGNLLIAYK